MGGEHPDWLPVDWKVSVKIRSSGRKDKYYIHPSNGLTFNSKPEVLRYLKSYGKMSKVKKINKINMKKTVAEKLPPGWIKEIRIKKSGGKTRRDPYYTDPVSGRQFRSMQEVFRYLKSEDSGEVETKSDDKGRTSKELVDHSQSLSGEAKEQRSIDKKGDKNMTDGESRKSGPDAVPLKNVEKPTVDKKKPKEKLLQENGNEGPNGGRRVSKRLAGNKLEHENIDSAVQSGSKVAAENNTSVSPETKGLEQRAKEKSCTEESWKHEDVAYQDKKKKLKRKWMNNLPRRTSRRLAHLEADQPVEEVKTNIKDGASARLSSKEEAASIKNAAKSEKSDEPELKTSVEFSITENPTNNDQKDSVVHQNLSPEEHKLEQQTGEKLGDSSLKDLLMDPCIVFAIKTLTGAIPIEDLSKVDENPVSSLAPSNQTSGYGDIWSDPCFEFAVKTLTGEMPPENDLQFKNLHKKPANPSESQKV